MRTTTTTRFSGKTAHRCEGRVKRIPVVIKRREIIVVIGEISERDRRAVAGKSRGFESRQSLCA